MKVLQVLMGHKDYTVTANTYAHVMDESKVEAMNKISVKMNKISVGIR